MFLTFYITFSVVGEALVVRTRSQTLPPSPPLNEHTRHISIPSRAVDNGVLPYVSESKQPTQLPGAALLCSNCTNVKHGTCTPHHKTNELPRGVSGCRQDAHTTPDPKNGRMCPVAPPTKPKRRKNERIPASLQHQWRWRSRRFSPFTITYLSSTTV